MRIPGSILAMFVWLGAVSLGPAWVNIGGLVPASAEPLVATAPSPGALCRAAIATAERTGAIPPLLMAAIGRVESGRPDPISGAVAPWPWTVDADGQGSFYDTKAQAIAAVRALQARGVQSIDVGCMQVNLMHHPGAFASLDQAFDPSANANYAARFLNELHGQTNDWLRAAAQYHSATPQLGAAYQVKVAAAWTEERRLAGDLPPMMRTWSGTPGAMPPVGGGGGFHGIVPTMEHATHPVGRGLAAYRAAPVLFATRAPPMVQRE